jgi:plasmid stabilization system protein ParE
VSRKPVVRRERPTADITAAVDYCLDTAGTAVALDFVNAAEQAIDDISKAPALGWPWFGSLLDIPGLRSRRTDGFPFMIVYWEAEDRIEAWRFLHERRDIGATLLDVEP